MTVKVITEMKRAGKLEMMLTQEDSISPDQIRQLKREATLRLNKARESERIALTQLENLQSICSHINRFNASSDCPDCGFHHSNSR